MLLGLFAAAASGGVALMESRSQDKVTEVSGSVGELPSVQGSIPVSTTGGGGGGDGATTTSTTAPTTTSTTTTSTTTSTTTTTTSTTTTVPPYDSPDMSDTKSRGKKSDWWIDLELETDYPKKTIVTVTVAKQKWSNGKWKSVGTYTYTCKVDSSGDCEREIDDIDLGLSNRAIVTVVEAEVGGVTYSMNTPSQTLSPPS
ncbi:MAG TPA: hypothetical protein VF183_14995 [Acidimicrobiales bacterium]